MQYGCDECEFLTDNPADFSYHKCAHIEDLTQKIYLDEKTRQLFIQIFGEQER